MALPILSINDFLTTETGSGSVTMTGEVANCVASGGDKAYVYRRIKAVSGATYKISCLARRVSGSDGTSGVLAVDYPDAGKPVNKVEINSRHWMRYEISYTVPLTAGDWTYIQVACGIVSGTEGEIEVTDFIVESAQVPHPTAVAAGLIYFDNGVPELNPSFANYGIENLSYDSGDKVLYVTIKNRGYYANSEYAPLIICNPDSFGDYDIDVRAGEYNRTTGELKIKFIDRSVSPPVLKDMTTVSDFYVWLYVT